MNLRRNLRTAVRVTLVTAVLFGLAYPLAVTLCAQWLFPDKSNGQLIVRGGSIVGSRLIGQPFSSPGYFRPRPSAAGAGYDPAASGGSNLGPTSRRLVERIRADVAALEAENPGRPIPVDLVTASGSGLDPDVSPAAAAFQVPRVARERGIPEAELRRIVARCTTGRTFGILGEPRVNVLMLNLALDERYPR
jgi:potassium-transporting ATPase KdpC subunit